MLEWDLGREDVQNTRAFHRVGEKSERAREREGFAFLDADNVPKFGTVSMRCRTGSKYEARSIVRSDATLYTYLIHMT
jgi:hypothetical protein